MIDEKSYKQTSKVVFQEGKSVASLMAHFPTDNELKFKDILDSKHIKYRFQKVFFKTIAGVRHTAECYYVAQFWLPRKRLFIEIPYGHRYKKPKTGDFRNYDALDVVKRVQCVKLSMEELNNEEFINNFIQLIK